MGGARPASNPTDRSAVGGADAFVGRVTVVAFARVFGEGAAPDAGVEGEAAVEDKGLLREESNLCMWVVSICFTALAVGARSDGWPEVVAPAEDDSAFFDVLFAEVTAGAATGAVTGMVVAVVVVGVFLWGEVLLCVDEVAAAAAAVVMGCSLGLATVALPGVAGRGGASGGVKGGSFCFFTAPDIAENKPGLRIFPHTRSMLSTTQLCLLSLAASPNTLHRKASILFTCLSPSRSPICCTVASSRW